MIEGANASREFIAMNTSESNPKAASDEFTRLYEACSDWLYCYLLSLLRKPADADDVLQETARVLWEKFDRYQPGTEFRAWACRVAHFKALQFRERQKQAPLAMGDLFFDAVDEEAVLMADQLDVRLEALTECMNRLPESQRAMLEQRFTQGDSVAAVAEAQGVSLKATYRKLSSIYEVLFRCIERALASGGMR